MVLDKIKKSKLDHEQAMKGYDEEVREHIVSYGVKSCDYLEYRIRMSNYHRGAYSALKKLQKDIS